MLMTSNRRVKIDVKNMGNRSKNYMSFQGGLMGGRMALVASVWSIPAESSAYFTASAILFGGRKRHQSFLSKKIIDLFY